MCKNGKRLNGMAILSALLLITAITACDISGSGEYFTVSFAANGGVPEPPVLKVKKGSKLEIPGGFEKSGFDFNGWYKDSACTVLWDFENDIVTGDIMLYAKWEPSGGSAVSSGGGGGFYGGGRTPTTYTVAVNPIGAALGDSVSATPASGTAGTAVTISYNVANTAAINSLDFSGTSVPILSVTGSGTTTYAINPTDAAGGAITIDATFSHTTPLLPGAPVSGAPSVASWTLATPSMTVTTVTNAGSTGQSVEYAISTSSTLPTTGWQSSTTFSVLGLSTAYYIFARTAEDSAYLAGTAQVSPPVAFIFMTPVASGSFRMGDDSTIYTNEQPEHPVTFTYGFNIGKYPVTQEQYGAVMGNNPSYFSTALGRLPMAGENEARRPVERVTWYDALEFCNRLSVFDGLDKVYYITVVSTTGNNITGATVVEDFSKNGYRLPTEAEWEYAAKGGNGPPPYFTYSGSNIVDDVAWYSGNSGTGQTYGMGTHEVGKLAPNSLVLGIYDMSGNVFEWCWDEFGPYDAKTDWNPVVGTSSGTTRILRGGSWTDIAGFSRSVNRLQYSPNQIDNGFGFRVARP